MSLKQENHITVYIWLGSAQHKSMGHASLEVCEEGEDVVYLSLWPKTGQKKTPRAFFEQKWGVPCMLSHSYDTDKKEEARKEDYRLIFYNVSFKAVRNHIDRLKAKIAYPCSLIRDTGSAVRAWRGIYLYRDGTPEKIFALIVHDRTPVERLNLSDLSAGNQSVTRVLAALDWPTDLDQPSKQLILHADLIGLIRLNSKRTPQEDILRWTVNPDLKDMHNCCTAVFASVDLRLRDTKQGLGGHNNFFDMVTWNDQVSPRALANILLSAKKTEQDKHEETEAFDVALGGYRVSTLVPACVVM